MSRVRLRAAWAALLLLALSATAVLLAPAAGADEAGAGSAPAQSALSAEGMEQWLREQPLAFALLVLLRYGTLLVGVVVLVVLWRRRDRIRAGLLPEPERAEPTLVFSPGRAIAILFAFFLGAQLVAFAIGRSLGETHVGSAAVEGSAPDGVIVRVSTGRVAEGDRVLVLAGGVESVGQGAHVQAVRVLPVEGAAVPEGDAARRSLDAGSRGVLVLDGPLRVEAGDGLGLYAPAQPGLLLSLGLNAAIFLPLAGIVFLRRRRLARPPPPPALQAAGRGFWTFCVANAVSVPALLLSIVLLQALGRPVTVYGPVQEVVGASAPWVPWVLALYAVVVAPLGEESVFRGMLYPAVRSAVGGGRRGAWVAALTVSALFALVHFHDLSFLPLFSLALVLAFVFERTNSLAAVIWAHAFFNGASMVPLLVRVAS